MKQMASKFIVPRYKYFLNFQTQTPPERYVSYSTDTSRTKDSARAQMESLFRNVEFKSEFLKVQDLSSDYLLHTDKKNCKLLKKLINFSKNSEHQAYIQEFINYLLVKYISPVFTEELVRELKE